MGQNFQKHSERLYQQIQEEYGKLVYTYTCHLKMAQILKRRNSFFKWLQIILSALSTGGFISVICTDEKNLAWAGALLSTILLVVTSYLKEVDLASDSKSHIKTASDLWPLREEYVSLMTDMNFMEDTDVITKRDDLLSKTAAVYSVALPTNEKAYSQAQEALKNREEQFFTQEELNLMLPIHLRKEK